VPAIPPILAGATRALGVVDIPDLLDHLVDPHHLLDVRDQRGPDLDPDLGNQVLEQRLKVWAAWPSPLETPVRDAR
jgi:hypothetical protein